MRTLLKLFTPKSISQDELLRYKTACEEISRALKAVGYNLKPYQNEEFKRFKDHPQRFLILDVITAWRDIVVSAVKDGDVLDDGKFVWRALVRFGFRPTDDLMEGITNDSNTIQIYSADNLLMFVNMRFFDYIHATIDEIFTIVWNRDSQRDMKVTANALHLALLIKTRQLKKSFVPTGMPKHAVTFSFSGMDQKVTIAVKRVYPLFGKQGMTAYLVNQETEVLYQKPSLAQA